jgi:hypothetical protein
MSARSAGARLAWGVLLSAVVLTGCPRRARRDTAASASASPSALPAPVASGLPASEVVTQVVNPKSEPAHSGPRGTVRGRIVATGDAPPDRPEVLKTIPENCAKGREAYAKLFREGPGRSLADVLVAVTGYSGYVPERESIVNAKADGCFWGTRTFVLTFGQRIDIVSGDGEAYIPELVGERGQPQIIATPGGKTASHLYPTRPGRYQIVDNLKLFMVAEVLVLKYSTHAVTGLDGRFEIPDVPAGPVTLSAMLPQTQVNASKSVTVEAGKSTEEIVIELPFDAAQYAKQLAAADAGAPSASAPKVDAGPPRGASSKN